MTLFCSKSKNCLFEIKLGICNPGHNIIELYIVLVQFGFAASKAKIDKQHNKPGMLVAIQVVEKVKT